MATKKEIKDILKELGKTEAEMDAYWEELKITNTLVAQLDRSGINWRKMNVSVIKDIPTQKERDITAAEEKRKKAEEEAKRIAEQEAEEKYYAENFNSIIIQKIDSKQRLTEDEIKALVSEYEVDTYKSDTGRWNQHVQTIVQVNEKYYAIDWQRGLTEYQENFYDNQPYEVKMHTYEKKIMVTEWKKVE